MRNLVRSLAASGLLLMAVGARAQDRDRDDDRYHYRDDRGYRGGGSLFERVQSDLNYAESNAYPSHGERRRIENAKKELWEFQRRWNSGRFDRHELDDSIAAIQKVVDHNALDNRARSILWADLQRLREFRAEYQNRGYDPRY